MFSSASSIGTLSLTAATLSVGSLDNSNGGTARLENGARLVVTNGATFTNNGTLDIITGSYSAPGDFINNGVVLDSSVVKIKNISRDATVTPPTVTVTMDGYSGHTYTLQRSNDLVSGTFVTLSSASGQNGVTGSVLTFTDPTASEAPGFYRVLGSV